MTALAIPTPQVTPVTFPEKRNDPSLYQWAIGRVLAHARENEAKLTQQQVADKLGITQRGYANVEHGITERLGYYFNAAEVLDRDILSVIGLARVLVRLVQTEELEKGPLDKKARDAIANDFFMKTG